MALTAGGSPYVESSDLVANYPGASLALANRVDQVMQAPTQNAQTGTTYTAVLLDAGKTVTLSNASAVTLTIPAQASVSWAANTQLNFLNIGAGTVTITPAADVTINGTPLTLATSKGGSLVRTAINTWTFTPSGGGGGGKVLQVVSVTKVDSFTTTSTSFVDVTGLTASITPSSTNSRILIIGKMAINPRSSGALGYSQLLRGNTVIGGGTETGSRPSAMSTFVADPAVGTTDLSFNFVDSPASVSSQTYQIQTRVNTGTIGINTTSEDNDTASRARTSSTITLMEIGA
jgi:hypothetical protein